MRGIVTTFSRLLNARAVIASAAILAGTAAPGLHARAQGKATMDNQQRDQVAYAVPRVAPHGGDGVALPQPLNPSDAALVRQIFDLQDRGKISAAVDATARLSNRMLLGRILADRYLSPYTRIGAPDLRQWLSLYGDQADAPAITALLRLRVKGRKDIPAVPALPSLAMPQARASADLDLRPADSGVRRQPAFDAGVIGLSLGGQIKQAVASISAARIDPLYGATLRAEVARTAFAKDRNGTAGVIARQAMQESHGRLGLPAFVAGLAAWRGHDDAAEALFGQAAGAPSASPELVAAASYWAARAALRAGKDMDYLSWMRRSAASGDGFYAMLADHMLGQDSPSGVFAKQTLGLADLDALASNPRAERAFALLQVGQADAAEAEFRMLYPEISGDPGLQRALMLVAWQAGMATLASQLASLDPTRGSATPVVIPPRSLFPRHGLHVDPALLYALVRVESNFDTKAVSGAGAQGLLQLMPATAAFMNHQGSGHVRRRASGLADPAFNLEMGQRYLNYLAQQTDGDLLRILVSYNAGPTQADGWDNAAIAMQDPLLYIEMIPNPETRHFVFGVLRYSWAYAAQLRLPSPSLDALAEGQFPRMTATAMAGSPTIH